MEGHSDILFLAVEDAVHHDVIDIGSLQEVLEQLVLVHEAALKQCESVGNDVLLSSGEGSLGNELINVAHQARDHLLDVNAVQNGKLGRSLHDFHHFFRGEVLHLVLLIQQHEVLGLNGGSEELLQN